jgi:hypothetical protein
MLFITSSNYWCEISLFAYFNCWKTYIHKQTSSTMLITFIHMWLSCLHHSFVTYYRHTCYISCGFFIFVFRFSLIRSLMRVRFSTSAPVMQIALYRLSCRKYLGKTIKIFHLHLSKFTVSKNEDFHTCSFGFYIGLTSWFPLTADITHADRSKFHICTAFLNQKAAQLAGEQLKTGSGD